MPMQFYTIGSCFEWKLTILTKDLTWPKSPIFAKFCSKNSWQGIWWVIFHWIDRYSLNTSLRPSLRVNQQKKTKILTLECLKSSIFTSFLKISWFSYGQETWNRWIVNKKLVLTIIISTLLSIWEVLDNLLKKWSDRIYGTRALIPVIAVVLWNIKISRI